MSVLIPDEIYSSWLLNRRFFHQSQEILERAGWKFKANARNDLLGSDSEAFSMPRSCLGLSTAGNSTRYVYELGSLFDVCRKFSGDGWARGDERCLLPKCPSFHPASSCNEGSLRERPLELAGWILGRKMTAYSTRYYPQVS